MASLPAEAQDGLVFLGEPFREGLAGIRVLGLSGNRGRCQLPIATMQSISAWQASAVFRVFASILVWVLSKTTLRS